MGRGLLARAMSPPARWNARARRAVLDRLAGGFAPVAAPDLCGATRSSGFCLTTTASVS
jgi:hypothetical protein